MWREGCTKTSGEEHYFTPLSSFLSLSAFLPFQHPLLCCLVSFPDGSKKKGGKNVLVFADLIVSERLLVPVSAAVFGNFCDNRITPP